MYERISIKWTDVTNEGLTGILTLDRWEGEEYWKEPDETHTCKCNVGESFVGMSGIGSGAIVTSDEKKITYINELMRAYYRGFHKDYNQYHWITEPDGGVPE